MNSKGNSIYELSKFVEQQNEKQYADEAKMIVNAYRQVHELKIPKKDPIIQSKPLDNYKGTSVYAIKIKQTLKALNSNKHKVEQNKNIREKKSNKNDAQIEPLHQMYNIALNKLLLCLCGIQAKNIQYGIQALKGYIELERMKEDQFILKWKLFRIFKAWTQQNMFSKLEKNKKKKIDQAKENKNTQIALEFRKFYLCKTAFSKWKIQIQREIKKKIYQRQLVSRQLENNKKQKIQIKQDELQSKVRGFLQNLKQKIAGQDRLRTIKEKTHQSETKFDLTEIKEKNDQAIEEVNHQQQRQPQIQQINLCNQEIDEVQKKNLTNDQLTKKRKDLQVKHKNRKQALIKLQKEKQQRKKEEENARLQLERIVEAEQKRLKQEKYRHYLKNKQEAEEWSKKEKLLQKQASQHNNLRLMKFFGWIPLQSLYRFKIQKCQTLELILLKIIKNFYFRTFAMKINQINQDKEEKLIKKIQQKYNLKLMKKSFKGIKLERKNQQQLKIQLKIKREVNSAKKILRAWKKLLPALIIENYEEERPLRNKCEQFRKLNMIYKGFQSLLRNKEEEKRIKGIEEQKKAIKEKIGKMLQLSSEVSYQQFL